MTTSLIQKYNVPGPRYTSYPTVPFWDGDININDYLKNIKMTFDKTNSDNGISVYIHLPFCESLCTYCGCNTRITKNHKVEQPYIKNILKEWEMYLEVFGDTPRISQIHLGGGTPTFFSPENLSLLIKTIKESSIVNGDAEFSFEAHPNNTRAEHLQVLFDLGFTRLSFGIQDFDPKVQEIVNRIQTYEQVEKLTLLAREIGYSSINYDLIYGLPLQTLDSVIDTIEKVNVLRPDRIAFYSYAHVPWLKTRQRKFTESDLPADEKKRELYVEGKKMFEQVGYKEIGMDHFALETDSLYLATKSKKLHRNFMGYSDSHTELMVGLGVSSIGDTWTAFGQNLKDFKAYNQSIEEGKFPIFRGHILNDEDLKIRKIILDIMCHFESKLENLPVALEDIQTKLKEIEDDGFIEYKNNTLFVTEKGIPFVRNICMQFDARLKRKKSEKQLFSKTI